eukprot:scaffold552_cov526-Prasinococcus_capsulatus_cf.AAC.30
MAAGCAWDKGKMGAPLAHLEAVDEGAHPSVEGREEHVVVATTRPHSHHSLLPLQRGLREPRQGPQPVRLRCLHSALASTPPRHGPVRGHADDGDRAGSALSARRAPGGALVECTVTSSGRLLPLSQAISQACMHDNHQLQTSS